ncbi:MAG: hypothetical protein JST19_01415 [Bacteroidetes bacterium]|nr:hypothetical protein [Bacteroidota bacterium]
MDAVFGMLIAIDVLCFLAIVVMLYNRIRGKDELHGLFRDSGEEKDA